MAALTRERILATAVAMADRDGLEAVTMRRIARELGVHVSSLYNHVVTWDAVSDGIVETLIDEAQLPMTPVDWEEWVREFFAAIGTVASKHPGAVAALQRRPVQGPRAAASFEVALDAFADAGLRPEDAYSAVKATALTALIVGLERSMSVRQPQPATVMDALPAETFPRSHALPATAGPEAAWAFTLETLVSGLRAEIHGRRTTG